MKELQLLIFAGESDTLDFKKRITHADRKARTIASFANTRGGFILVGVMDSRRGCKFPVSGFFPKKHTTFHNNS